MARRKGRKEWKVKIYDLGLDFMIPPHHIVEIIESVGEKAKEGTPEKVLYNRARQKLIDMI